MSLIATVDDALILGGAFRCLQEATCSAAALSGLPLPQQGAGDGGKTEKITARLENCRFGFHRHLRAGLLSAPRRQTDQKANPLRLWSGRCGLPRIDWASRQCAA